MLQFFVMWVLYKRRHPAKESVMRNIANTIMIVALMVTAAFAGKNAEKMDKGANNGGVAMQKNAVDIKHIKFETITGDTVDLASYPGKAILVVNVASKCGNTPQYAGLEELYKKYADSGLVILGFPANNFGGQEPGTNEEILKFCTTTYEVSFPMMSKISVKGKNKHPLYVELTENSNKAGEIKWNFAKFLLDSKGNVVARFDPKTKPESEEVVGAIEKLLRTS
jgi:glutathione peroxidase